MGGDAVASRSSEEARPCRENRNGDVVEQTQAWRRSSAAVRPPPPWRRRLQTQRRVLGALLLPLFLGLGSFFFSSPSPLFPREGGDGSGLGKSTGGLGFAAAGGGFIGGQLGFGLGAGRSKARTPRIVGGGLGAPTGVRGAER